MFSENGSMWSNIASCKRSLSCVSGFAGIWFEKMLKFGKRKEIWFANIQLAAFGTVLGLIVSFFKDREEIAKSGYFYGFTPWVYAVVGLQGAGGLLVSMVVKYADNILKVCVLVAESFSFLNVLIDHQK